jgi:hydrophobe/amphiphile efflux-1 (HAE1) family protein
VTDKDESISAPFVRRPVATILLAVALFLAGALAYKNLPVSPLPRVDFPTIQVSASMPGASPETMASAVATPLERRFGRIAGVTEITSSSTLGSTSITLQFDLNRDIDAAARDIQAAIAEASGELPPNLPQRPTFKKVNPSDSPIMIISLTSDTVPLNTIYEQANTILAQKISQVAGVGQVTVGGGQQPAVRVRIDPIALAGSGLSYEDVRNALQSSTAAEPKGGLVSVSRGQTVNANDQLSTAAQFGELVLSKQTTGGTVKLKDVAEVLDSVQDVRVAAWETGKRAVVMIITRQPGANILETNARIRKLLPSLATSIAPDTHVVVAIDRTQTIEASVHDVEFSLVLSVALVVGVVFAFLRSWRATAVPSIAVPLSLVGTFAIMYLFGYSIDNLSLMALTISTGFVVDDAIVVTENIARYVEDGVPPFEAALMGAKQIGFTIVSITISLLAVFIPILFMAGIVGRLFREFAVTLAIAITLSALISLTLTPMMSARLLKSPKGEKHGRAFQLSERFFEGMVHLYDRGLVWALGHRRFMQLLTLATIALTVTLFIVLPKGLFPQQDTGVLMGQTEAPQDVSFATMLHRSERVNEVLKADPDIDRFVAFTGGAAGTINQGRVFISLKPKPARKASADEVIGRLRQKFAKVEGIVLYLQAIQDVRVGGRLSKTQYQYTLQSADLATLRQYAPLMVEGLKKQPELKDVATDQQTEGQELDVTIDHDSASRLGLTTQVIDDTLYDAFGQRLVSIIYSPLNQYHIVLDIKDKYQDPTTLDSMYFGSPSGLVPLPAIAKISQKTTALAVTHQGQFPSITLSFNVAPGKALGDAVAAVHKAEGDVGLPASVRGDFSGTAQVFNSSLASEPILVVFALCTVYIVLGVLYESWLHPVTILSTIPSAGVGALLALLITGFDFSVIALIGIILLIGIVKKNAIMMVDFAIEAEREHGLSPQEAIHQACLLRFRPIMMTTLAALLGAVPLAFGRGMGAEFRQPLGIAIVGGLIVSQMLTLFTTPIVYLTLDRGTKPIHTAAALRAPDLPAQPSPAE